MPNCHLIVTFLSFVRNRPPLASPANTNSTPSMHQNTATWAKLAVSVFFCGLAASSAPGQSSDALLNKLVSKGVLTAEEAKELSKDVVGVKAEPNKLSLPSWISNLKLYGDFRGRYDGTFQHEGNFQPDPTIVGPGSPNVGVTED